MKNNILLICVSTLFCSFAFSQSNTTVTEKITLHNMDCETFVGLRDDYQEKVYYWTSSKVNKNTHVTIGDIENRIPVIIEYCKKSPGKNFYEVVKIYD